MRENCGYPHLRVNCRGPYKKRQNGSIITFNFTSNPKTEVEKGITVISRGEGVHVFDSEGNKYIDLVAGVTRPVHLGYGNAELAQAIYDQIMELAYFTPLMFANEPAIKLAELLFEITPVPLISSLLNAADLRLWKAP